MFLTSKIVYKIGALVAIITIFIISSFGILAYFQSQETYLGNSINIAGKNRFLTANVLFQASEYLTGSSFSPPPNSIQLNDAMDKLQINISILKDGGKISEIELKPLPSEFLDSWNAINDRWHNYKTFIIDRIIKSGQQQQQQQKLKTITTAVAEAILDLSTKTELESMAMSLINSSDMLVTQLGDKAKKDSQNFMLLEILFGIMNIAVVLLILYLVIKILRPISALTHATYEIKKGNLDVSVKHNRNDDELSLLSESSNSMVGAIKNYIKKQNELADDLKKLNEELKHKDRLKDEFINIAAHELRTPIQPILGLSEVIRSRKANFDIDREDDEFLSIIIRNAKRLQRLSADILDVTKIESHSLMLKKEKFNLNEIILNAVEDYTNQIESDGKQNEINLLYNSGQAIFVEADRGRLIQVISNLISNAVKFTEVGTITITAEKKDYRQVVVSVKDTGNGIDPAILPKLFTKFATKSDKGTGIGLGLYISKNIVETHVGRIWAENNNDRKGATFAFALSLIN